MRTWRIALAFLGIAALCAPAFGAEVARPGTVNYVEGAVYLNGNRLTNKEVGSTDMNAGQILRTGTGKAEILLNPGIYLRVDDHSAVKMISPDVTPTQVELVRGRAAVEVDQLLKQNVVQIVDHGVTTQLVKTGYYEFSAIHPRAMVFKGRAEVQEGNGKWEAIKGDHELPLVADAHLKAAKFQPDPQEDALMNWSKLRSEYLAEANNQIAGEYYGAGFYPGWYWDPWMWDYTYLGWGPFYSPFGWGYYPMGWGWGGWGWGGWYGRGFYGAHGWHGGHGFRGVPRGGFRGGAGGFHGGAGGFHGGMGGGGFHGGGRA